MALLMGIDPLGAQAVVETVATEPASLAQLGALVSRLRGDGGLVLIALLLIVAWGGPKPPRPPAERQRRTLHAASLGTRTLCDEPIADCPVGSVIINVAEDGSESARIEDLEVLEGEPADECAACLALLPRLSWEPAA